LLEVGPGATLTALARETLGGLGAAGADGTGPLLASSLARGREDAEVLLSALGQVWVRGAPVNWAAVDGVETAAAPLTPTNGAGHAPPAAAPEEAPLPTTLFNTEIDPGQISRTLAQLREGRLSTTEALTSIQAGLGPSAGGAS
jgi:acyl transferase domain-containing protein